ncbi:MAG TPA: coenzyme F420-0:L-glutamate ligase, partial [Anaerolineaceae bacterium]|nr:coenzyme F420-0:L-glutamate ligase [Anaerolineaceae bacterium]
MTIPRSLTLTAIPGLPEVKPGDDLATLIATAVEGSALSVQDNDIFVIAQKIVSKSEGRLVNLSTVQPSPKALEIAKTVEKRPELVELILQESNSVLRMRP